MPAYLLDTGWIIRHLRGDRPYTETLLKIGLAEEQRGVNDVLAHAPQRRRRGGLKSGIIAYLEP